MNCKKTIGQKIKEARLKKGITQNKLASITGVSRSYISDIENGRYIPSVLTLTSIASTLKINLNFLCKNDGNTNK